MPEQNPQPTHNSIITRVGPIGEDLDLLPLGDYDDAILSVTISDDSVTISDESDAYFDPDEFGPLNQLGLPQYMFGHDIDNDAAEPISKFCFRRS